MKKILVKILAFIFFFAIMLISAQGALALEIPNPLGPDGSTIPGLVDKITEWLLKIGLMVSTIVILWAAMIFVTSGGNKERVTTARQTLWYAVIGIAILILAKSISSFVVGLIGG